MMASMIRAAGKGATKTNGPRVARARRSSPSLSKRVVRVHAEEEEKESETTEVRFNLGEAIQSESTNAARGYTAEDSAGQENIFAIEPRVYVAGSEMDDGQGQGGSFVWAVLGIITFGLVTTMMFLVREENATPVEGEKVEEASVSTSAVETEAAERVEEEASQVAPDVAAE
mmetsp:Transcript_10858/g.67025  ORF Transcript_10858/g.67025 Transcript_10858/m.67025 type:complete len:172 (-) Transcript_10858:372-887(-)